MYFSKFIFFLFFIFSIQQLQAQSLNFKANTILECINKIPSSKTDGYNNYPYYISDYDLLTFPCGTNETCFYSRNNEEFYRAKKPDPVVRSHAAFLQENPQAATAEKKAQKQIEEDGWDYSLATLYEKAFDENGKEKMISRTYYTIPVSEAMPDGTRKPALKQKPEGHINILLGTDIKVSEQITHAEKGYENEVLDSETNLYFVEQCASRGNFSTTEMNTILSPQRDKIESQIQSKISNATTGTNVDQSLVNGMLDFFLKTHMAQVSAEDLTLNLLSPYQEYYSRVSMINETKDPSILKQECSKLKLVCADVADARAKLKIKARESARLVLFTPQGTPDVPAGKNAIIQKEFQPCHDSLVTQFPDYKVKIDAAFKDMEDKFKQQGVLGGEPSNPLSQGM